MNALLPDHVRDVATELAASYLPDGTMDLVRLAGLLDPEVTLHVPGTQPLAGDHHGIPAVAEFTLASREITVDGERLALLDTLVGERHVAALVHVRAERPDGRSLDNVTLHLARLGDDGSVVEIWFHNRDQAHVDGFWS